MSRAVQSLKVRLAQWHFKNEIVHAHKADTLITSHKDRSSMTFADNSVSWAKSVITRRH